jgi:hypothetical protein
VLIRLTFVGFLLRRPVFGSCEAGDGEGVRGGKHWGYLLVEAGENSRFCFLFVCKLWFNNILIHLVWDRDVQPLQKLCKDVVKGVIAYVKVKKDATFPGPSPMDYTSLNSKENIYNSCFPDSSVYVYPKVTESLLTRVAKQIRSFIWEWQSSSSNPLRCGERRWRTSIAEGGLGGQLR